MNVLVVDDHEMIRETLLRYLSELEGVSATEAHDFPSAFTAITTTHFDLVLLDIRMPGVDGFTALTTLRGLFPALRIAILSGSVDVADSQRAFDLGAVGYLTKAMERAALLHAMRRILSGDRFFAPQTFETTTLGSDLLPVRNAEPAGQTPGVGAVSLTERQRMVMHELSKGLSNRQIGEALGITEITVKIHMHSILQKLGVRNRTQAVQRARDIGLI